VKIRRATENDLPTIVRWREERATWLREQGSDQWNDAGLTRDAFVMRVTQSIADGETWMVVNDDDSSLGTIAIDTEADPGLWSQAELSSAYVLHRMISDKSSSGTGIGDAMLEHAEQLARTDGKTRLILDAWTSNEQLHAYYERKGFRYVRTVSGHSTPSATLFERSVKV
jgi:GNAT superfamily N-acetyltransferase